MKNKETKTLLIIGLILALFISSHITVYKLKEFKIEKTYSAAVDCVIARDYDEAINLLKKIEERTYKDKQALLSLCNLAKAVDENRESTMLYKVMSADYLNCSNEQHESILALRAELLADYEQIEKRVKAEKQAKEAAEAASLKSTVPYTGMREANISKTSLGRYSSKREDTYYSVGKNHPYTVYDFKDGNKTIFSVRCENGEVTDVWDYRNIKPVKPKKVSEEDRYNASDYRNAEDFYDDNYYAFHDYYQAEKYWREHHDK